MDFFRNELKYPYGKPPAGIDVLWRCEAKRYSYVIDADVDLYGTTDPELQMCWYEVLKWTPTGARLVSGKLVYLNKRVTNRQWASRTPEEALQSFKERKRRQIRILQRQLADAECEFSLAVGAK